MTELVAASLFKLRFSSFWINSESFILLTRKDCENVCECDCYKLLPTNIAVVLQFSYRPY